MSMTRLLSAVTLASMCLILAGCGGGGSEAFNNGFYRFVHVSPGTDSVNISANGNQIVGSLSYHSASPYISLAWGLPDIKVVSADSGTVYADGLQPVGSDGHYSYFLYGGGQTPIAISIREDVSDAPSASFLLREIHLATGIGAVDIYVLAPNATVDSASGPSAQAVGYTTVSVYASYSIGDYHIAVTPTGTKTVIYDTGIQSFTNNTKASLLIYATGSGQLVNGALLIENSGVTTFIDNTTSRYKFITATPDQPQINVLIDGTIAYEGIAYGSVSPYAVIAAGNHNLKIEATSTPGVYLYDQNQPLKGGYDQSLVAVSLPGLAGGIGVLALQDNNLPPPTGKVKLRIVNASSDTTAYDAYANTTKLISNLPAGGVSAYQVIDPASYTLAFDIAGTTNVAASVPAALSENHVYTVYVYGRNNAASAVLTTDY
jgi:hypothetical protein